MRVIKMNVNISGLRVMRFSIQINPAKKTQADRDAGIPALRVLRIIRKTRERLSKKTRMLNPLYPATRYTE
jgi:hypothetical protein